MTVAPADGFSGIGTLLPQSQVVAGYKPVMPTFQGHISEDELLKVIAYIKAIGKNEGAGQ